jgi:hypothetical protein
VTGFLAFALSFLRQIWVNLMCDAIVGLGSAILALFSYVAIGEPNVVFKGARDAIFQVLGVTQFYSAVFALTFLVASYLAINQVVMGEFLGKQGIAGK